MNRADGYRIESSDLIYESIPHIMDRRYDASNYRDLEIDAETVQSYVNKWRRKGVMMSHMAVILAAQGVMKKQPTSSGGTSFRLQNSCLATIAATSMG